MSRWNETVDLISTADAYQDESGTWHSGEKTYKTVFCNPGTLGIMTMSQMRSSEVRITNGEAVPEAGLRNMSVIYIRAVDYDGQQSLVFRGKEMDVYAVTTEGENYKCIIRERLGNE